MGIRVLRLSGGGYSLRDDDGTERGRYPGHSVGPDHHAWALEEIDRLRYEGMRMRDLLVRWATEEFLGVCDAGDLFAETMFELNMSESQLVELTREEG